MVFVGEEKEFAGYASQLGGIEGTHSLGVGNPVIFLSVDDHDWGIPIVNEAVG